MRICVLRGGAIGDFVLTLPALRLLRSRWPDAHIECVAYPHIAGLGVAGGDLDRVLSLDKAEMARLFVPNADLPEPLRDYVRSFDLLICYLYDPDELVRTNLLRAGARQVLSGSPLVTSGHAIEHLLKPLEALALYPAPCTAPTLRLGRAHLQAARTTLHSLGIGPRWVALHPGSGNPAKNWPLSNFAALAQSLRKRSLCPVYLAGDAELPMIDAIERLKPATPILREATLVGLAGMLSLASGYVGNDSGITHLAAALGIPCVALFRNTDPSMWAPRGPRVTVIVSDADCTTECESEVRAAWAGLTRTLHENRAMFALRASTRPVNTGLAQG